MTGLVDMARNVAARFVKKPVRSGQTQQLVTTDEITAAEIGQMWMDTIILERKLGGRALIPGTEIRVDHGQRGDITTTLWHRNLPIAIAIRQRDEFNNTVLSVIEFP